MTATSRSLLALFVGVGVLAGGRFAPAAEGEKEKAPPSPAPDAKPDPADRSLREAGHLHPLRQAPPGLREARPRRVPALRGVRRSLAGRPGEDAAGRRGRVRPSAPSLPRSRTRPPCASDVVQVKAHLKIDLLAEGWHEVPLRLADAAIVRATLAGEPARDPRRRRRGPSPPGREEGQAARVDRARAGIRQGDHPLAGAEQRFVRDAAGPGEPLAGADSAGRREGEPPAADRGHRSAAGRATAASGRAKPAADETVVLAFVGAVADRPHRVDPQGRRRHRPGRPGQRPGRPAGLDPARASSASRANLAYTISRAELGQLAVDVPADYKVRQRLRPQRPPVVGRASPAPDRRHAADHRSTVRARQGLAASRPSSWRRSPARRAAQSVKQADSPVMQGRSWSVRAVGVGRQQGFVVVQVGSGLRAEASPHRRPARRSMPASCPATWPPAAWTFAYRYAAVPFELELAVEEVQPRITVDSLVEARLEPNRLTLDLTAVYTIERAGVFKLELDRPAGFEVRQVRGREIPGDAAHAAAAVAVDSHHLEGKKQERLVVNLARKAMGRVALCRRVPEGPAGAEPAGADGQVGRRSRWALPQVRRRARSSGPPAGWWSMPPRASASMRARPKGSAPSRSPKLSRGCGWATADCPNFRPAHRGLSPARRELAARAAVRLHPDPPSFAWPPSGASRT